VKHLIGAIYDPPELRLPVIAIVMDVTGEVVRVRTAPSRRQAEAFLAEMKRELTADTNDH
jgi:hypothetical protein